MRTLIFIGLAVVFNTIFWEEELALNWLLFVLLVLGVQFRKVLKLLHTSQGRIVVPATIVSTVVMVWQHTPLSIFAALISFICCIGLLHYPEIRTTYAAGFSATINFFKLPEVSFRVSSSGMNHRKRNFTRIFRMAVLPFIILLVFFLLFRGANVVFRSATDRFFSTIGDFLEYLFADIALERVVFFMVALAMASWVWFDGRYGFVRDGEVKLSDALFRRKTNVLLNPMAMRTGQQPIYRRIGTIALKNENRSAFWMIVSVCVLLAIINCIDIVYVWFGQGYRSGVDYSAKVHEGVYFLIASILLSIAIILYVFRRNQNFYALGNRLIKWSAIWILLNGVLVVSVFLRNYYYISYQGLTYKRVGVVVFLIVVALGLVSLLIKIRQRKSFFYMAKYNSWSIFAVLICASSINWDVLICRYNIRHVAREKLDIEYLMDLSDEAVLELTNAKTLVTKNFSQLQLTEEEYGRVLGQKLWRIRNRRSSLGHSLWSWNLQDVRVDKLLKKIPESDFIRPEQQRRIY